MDPSPKPEQVTDVGGFLASARHLDAHYSDVHSFDTIQQVSHARVLTQQTIGALERQLAECRLVRRSARPWRHGSQEGEL